MEPPFPSIELMPIASLRPYSGNARTHSRRQVRQIADSIQRFGFTNPVLISDDHEIVAGHGRVLAAKQLGIAAVPTVKLSRLSAEERRAYVLASLAETGAGFEAVAAQRGVVPAEPQTAARTRSSRRRAKR